MTTPHDDHDTRLRIGAVSRLTDLSVHVLRKWEKRYGAVEPIRTPGGGRLYTRLDVHRLALIKQLTRAGAPLSEIARCSLERLEEMAKETLRPDATVVAGFEPPASVRLVIVGDALPTLLQADADLLENLELVSSGKSVAELKSQLEGEEIDLLVQEYPTVHPGLTREITEGVTTIGARGAIAVYGFGSRESLRSLRRSGIALIRAPIDPGELQHVALGLMQQLTGWYPPTEVTPILAMHETVPPPRLARDVVARVTTSTPAMRCECPHHLADIISSLLAFERYSLECENRNEDDAVLHHYLAMTAGRSRVAFEDALVEVAKAEGIDLGV